jgi:hypothetical protein
VFDAIVGTALRLLSCDFTALLRCDGSTFTPVAAATPGGLRIYPEERVVPVDPARNFPSRVMLSKAMLHIPDWTAVDVPPHEREVRELTGVNSSLMLPLMRKDECIGVLVLARDKAGAFTDKEIALAKSFVDQAVIAIENVRLFNETKEALERQTATAEVLKVISESPTDVQPVFDIIAERAAILTGAESGIVFRYDGEWIHFRQFLWHGIRIHGKVQGAAAGAIRCVFYLSRGNPQRRGGQRSGPAGARPHRRIYGCGHEGSSPARGSARWPCRPDVPRRQARRRHCDVSQQGREIRGQRGRPAARVRKPGRHRHRERALFTKRRKRWSTRPRRPEVLDVISHSMADATPVFDKIHRVLRAAFSAPAFALGIVDAGKSGERARISADSVGKGAAGEGRGRVHRSGYTRCFPRPLPATLTEKAIRSGRLVEILQPAGRRRASTARRCRRRHG